MCIGAIYLVVFGGFFFKSLYECIIDVGVCVVVIVDV